MKIKSSRSLLTKYLLLIVIAIIIVPASLFIFSTLFYHIGTLLTNDAENHYNLSEIGPKWHEQARQLDESHPQMINQTLKQFKKQYPSASMFWVDHTGKTRYQLPQKQQIPDVWNVSDTIDFMKEKNDGGLYTVVSYISDDKQNGFMVIRIPMSSLNTQASNAEYFGLFWIFGITILLIAFIIVSYVFFNRIRKRLIGLQEAMTVTNEQAIPDPVVINKKDEIGDLEQSFNQMITTLEESREKEQEEERLRRQLIANLSHDLRTPLTSLRSQVYKLKENPPEQKKQETLSSVDHNITFMGELIDNLLSYSLLNSHKYPYHPEKIELIRFVRRSLADWYEVLEGEGFKMEIYLPDIPIYSHLDPNWLRRMLDNVIQNVIRHASSGHFIGVQLTSGSAHHCLAISDKGPGFEHANTYSKGTGIGLSILSLMAEEMDIKWDIESNDEGSKVVFKMNHAFSEEEE